MKTRASVRQVLGTFWHDWPRLAWCLRPWSRHGWVRMRNREDVLHANPGGLGVRCEWVHTRPLHLCAVFPCSGRILMRRAFSEWPVRWADFPIRCEGTPDVSFLVGHCGADRTSLLLATLRSIAAQQGVAAECIVAEQGECSVLGGLLPGGVRHVFIPSAAGAAYNRSRLFNAAAAQARGKLLILHDGDLVVPAAYAAEVLRLAQDGFDVVNAKRFIFYMARPEHGASSLGGLQSIVSWRIDMVLENATGGGSVAVTRDAFDRMGRMDEDFEGWGCEDVDFWERAQSFRVFEHGYLPLVHLWHAPQAGRGEPRAENESLLQEKRRQAAAARIAHPAGGADGLST